MTAVYLGSFIAGLFIGVGIMLFGIERRAADAASRPMLRLWIPLVAAFAAGSGIAGYLTSRTLAAPATFATAVGVGIVSAGLMRWIIARSAAMVPEHDIEDERYVLQGHIARVVAAIDAGGEGKIGFEVGGMHRTFRARGLDDAAVDAGTEVVIERIDGDVAYVEPWVFVERRL
jgi:membrane protein implicated in regulation of membrane protease activity